MIRRPPRTPRTDTLFPYPSLFRSFLIAARKIDDGRVTQCLECFRGQHRAKAGLAVEDDWRGRIAHRRPDTELEEAAADIRRRFEVAVPVDRKSTRLNSSH